jgi:AmmeMemoRadiSam system protein B/AmmeMemoRadiSam system protein A
MKLIPSIISTLSVILFIVSDCQALQVKEPAVAGAFYPADAPELKRSVDGYLSGVRPGKNELSPLALIVPHAGHIYSGAVAAEGYARLKGRKITTVILIGPSHHVPLQGAAIYPGDGMKTPLGILKVDRVIVKSLLTDSGHVRADAAPFAREHSLEVQLPFLQRAIGQDVRIVPILIGNPDQESLESLSSGIAKILKASSDTLLVMSTDLSHFHDQAKAKVLDTRVIDAVERLSRGDLERLLTSGRGEMCGGWPVVYGMVAARAAGATHAVTYSTANSGKVSGDSSRVVGYASIGIVRGSLTENQRKQLIELARTSVINLVNGSKLPEAASSDPLLRADGAVFVTINGPNGQLRGCIGTIHPRSSLQSSVIQNAVAAASQDRRFMPVRLEELNGLSFEVTVLSPQEPLADIHGIVIGKHGLYMETGGHSSVFLPQVPVEQGWDLQTYLSQLSLKAGIGPDGWRNARLSVFTADVIRQHP